MYASPPISPDPNMWQQQQQHQGGYAVGYPQQLQYQEPALSELAGQQVHTSAMSLQTAVGSGGRVSLDHQQQVLETVAEMGDDNR